MALTGTCRYAGNNNRPLYWDGGHVNKEGARFIAPKLENTLRDLINSPKVLGK